MTPRNNLNKSTLRLCAGWCGLMLYVGALSPVGLGAMALLGTLDRDHHAVLQPGTEGIRLVLHHEGNCTTHQHGPVARALTMFARPASTTDPDHVLQFSSATSLMRTSQAVAATPDQSTSIVPEFADPIKAVADESLELILRPRPPPDTVGNLLNTRFTIFLI